MHWLELAKLTARLMVGVPSYEAYVSHRAVAHPGEPVMDRGKFYAERLEKRFGGVSRCC
ncbi:YbdD/YjiX family protein [Sphingosinicella rhizophila]|uniref:YbdD/YjiX family protein n=1 Tax=Sphingosinicella rhizophila TaxID=3050082 RepID=A0ABU3Q8Z4_9SPHN|nr:YbdD/YjiX family protein [Sphingosinicella sp. GR2756]MDT9599762.1 YbdD/YjiX family protein [Sphingosinicella sp. GR2756]